MSEMSMRQRMMAVIKGLPVDRVPFVQYPWTGVHYRKAWDHITEKAIGVLFPFTPLYDVVHPSCTFESKEMDVDGIRARRTSLTTPKGSLVEEIHYSPALGSPAHHEYYVKNVEDYAILQSFIRDCSLIENTEHFRTCEEEIGEHGLTWAAIPRTPYQRLWIEWVSIEHLALHMADAPDVVEETLALLGSHTREIMELTRRVMERIEVPCIDFPDNITAPMIGEPLFRKHCLPYYSEMAAMAKSVNPEAIIAVHMDGELRPLAKAIAESGVQGLDSFTPPPDCDLTVAEALIHWPEMRLFVNVPSSVHLREHAAVKESVLGILQQGAGSRHLWLQISEDVPSFRWRESYPAIVEAIKEFGEPAVVAAD